MGGRLALVIASQCASLNLLSFLPKAAADVADALLDPAVGGCEQALADRRLVVDPTAVELEDAVTAAFERAHDEEATLVVSLVGHGEYNTDDFYFLTHDSTLPPLSRHSFHLAQRFKELLSRYSMIDGLVLLLDTCHAGLAAQQAAATWVNIVGQAGRRFEVLTASDDRTAADGCFSRSLASVLRAGRSELGERLRCPDLKRVIGTACPRQTAVHLAFDGVRTVEHGDEGLWLAVNAATEWDLLRGHPDAVEIERLTTTAPPLGMLRTVVGQLLMGARHVVMLDHGDGARTGDRLIAALARPSVADGVVPRGFVHGVLLERPGRTSEQTAHELAGQLRVTVPGFATAHDTFADSLDDDGFARLSAFERAVLGPLRLLGPEPFGSDGGPVRLAVGRHDTVPRWLLALADDDHLDGAVSTVLVSDTAVTWPGAITLELPRPEPPVLAPPPPSPTQGMGSAGMSTPGNIEQLSYGGPGVIDWMDGVSWSWNAAGIVTLLGSTPLPIAVLAAASRLRGGPGRLPSLRDELARLGDTVVVRSTPGTPEEHVRLAGYQPPRSSSAHEVLAEAITEVAPVSERDNRGPEQSYADANEAEHLWKAGRHADAVDSLEARPSSAPVENRERWREWARHVARALGDDHPLTLRCRARHATWTGKSGEPGAALDAFAELLPAVERTGDVRESLSIRNNIGFLLGELGRHAESRDVFATLTHDAARELGPHDEETLHARHLLAVATGKREPDGHEALRLSRELLPEAEQALGSEHWLLGHVRHNISYWSAEIGDPPPDLEEHRRLVEDERRRLNDDRHPDVLAVRFTHALALAKTGRGADALREWESQLGDAVAVLGDRHPQTAKIREQLEYWRE